MGVGELFSSPPWNVSQVSVLSDKVWSPRTFGYARLKQIVALFYEAVQLRLCVFARLKSRSRSAAKPAIRESRVAGFTNIRGHLRSFLARAAAASLGLGERDSGMDAVSVIAIAETLFAQSLEFAPNVLVFATTRFPIAIVIAQFGLFLDHALVEVFDHSVIGLGIIVQAAGNVRSALQGNSEGARHDLIANALA